MNRPTGGASGAGLAPTPGGDGRPAETGNPDMAPQEGRPPAPGAPPVSRVCQQGMHNFCRLGPSGCGCPTCHRGPCTRCGASDLLREWDGLCVDCYRSDCRERSSHAQSACDRCGRAGAFRNPAARSGELLCVACHQAAGTSLPLTPSVQGLVAACRGADEDDLRHDWHHVRGNTFGCVSCKVRARRPDWRAAMRREDLRG